MHRIRNMHLAGSPAVANRPAEAALCVEVTCEHLEARFPSEYAEERRLGPRIHFPPKGGMAGFTCRELGLVSDHCSK
jgi:hypothetical protein